MIKNKIVTKKNVLVLLAISGVLSLLVEAVKFGNTHYVQSPIREVRSPIVLQKVFPVRNEQEILYPLVEAMEISDVDDMSDVDKVIYTLWGDRYYLLARSVFKCESGLRADAVNWKSGDLGIAQINWAIWEKPILDKFGYTIKDMFDVDKNLEVAYWIWDRGDGVEDDGKGNFQAWVVYNNGAFMGCID